MADTFSKVDFNPDVYFIRVPYFCSPIDATVSIAMGDFVRLYLVEQTPTYRLVNEWAIPADHPLAARARVRLTSIRVDTESELVTARITDRLKTGSSATPFVSVLAVYAWRIPVALLDEQLRAQLQNTASIKLPSDLSKAISADIVKKRIVPMGVVSQYPRDVVALLKQAPLEQIPARGGNAFELRDEDQGHRFFYPVVSPASPEFQIRVKGIESGRYGLFYDVQAGVILWPDWEIMQHARPQ